MKKLILQLLFIPLVLSCSNQISPEQQKVNKKMADFLTQINDEFKTVGEWQVSPTGDSLWTISSTAQVYNYNMMDKAGKNIQPIMDSISELLFKAKKYDSVPRPSQNLVDWYKRLLEKQIGMSSYSVRLLELIKLGEYNYDGKKLK